MEIVPTARTARFEQIEAGDLFIFMDGDQKFYALKTGPSQPDNRNGMVLLGPSFPQDITESFFVSWKPVTVLSFGKNFSILPSLDPNEWSLTGPSRAPVCLAVAGENAYICTNGGFSPQHYLPWFINIKTGVVVEGRPAGLIVFTNNWEITMFGENHPPRSLLKYPLF